MAGARRLLLQSALLSVLLAVSLQRAAAEEPQLITTFSDVSKFTLGNKFGLMQAEAEDVVVNGAVACTRIKITYIPAADSAAVTEQWPNATPFGIDHIGGKDYLKLGSRYWMMNQDTSAPKGCAGFINLVSSPSFAFQINHAADTIVAAGQLLVEVRPSKKSGDTAYLLGSNPSGAAYYNDDKHMTIMTAPSGGSTPRKSPPPPIATAASPPPPKSVKSPPPKAASPPPKSGAKSPPPKVSSPPPKVSSPPPKVSSPPPKAAASPPPTAAKKSPPPPRASVRSPPPASSPPPPETPAVSNGEEPQLITSFDDVNAFTLGNKFGLMQAEAEDVVVNGAVACTRIKITYIPAADSEAVTRQWPNATPFGIDHIGGSDYLKLGSRYWMMNQDTSSPKGCVGFINLVSTPSFAFQINHGADTITKAGNNLIEVRPSKKSGDTAYLLGTNPSGAAYYNDDRHLTIMTAPGGTA